jgi:ribosomal protein L7/L12
MLPAGAVAALEQGKKLEAIKIVRLERGVQLIEAKAAVERYLRQRPELESRLAQIQAGAQRAALAWMLGIVFVILLVWYLAARS